MQQQKLNAAAAQLMGLPQRVLHPGLPNQATPHSPFPAAMYMPKLMPPDYAPHMNAAPTARASGGLYPSLENMMDEGFLPMRSQYAEKAQSSSSLRPSPALSSRHQFSPSHHARLYSNSNSQQRHASSTSQGALEGKSNILHGRSKRTFTEEADALLEDLKKKKYDPSDISDCTVWPHLFIFILADLFIPVDHRLDSLSSFLLETDPHQSEFFSALPQVVVDAAHSSSDGSSHSSSNYSPRSASGSLKSPAEPPLEISKTEIDDINHLLYSFGAQYNSSDPHPKYDAPWSYPATTAPGNSHSSSELSRLSTYGAVQSTSELLLSNGSSGSLYPSLSGLSASKPIKPLPTAHRTPPPSAHKSQPGLANVYQTHRRPSYDQQLLPLPQHQSHPYTAGNIHQSSLQHSAIMPSVSFNYLAPPCSVPTPFISPEYMRDPIMNSVQLLSSAPPIRDTIARQLSEDEIGQRNKQVSSLRSTASEEASQLSPGPMSEDDFEEPESTPEPAENFILPPIDHSEPNGSEHHLPSLRSVLSTAKDVAQGTDSSPPLTASSSSSTSHKRCTSSRQSYPSLTPLSSKWPHDRKGAPPRLSTGDKLDHITKGVDSFRMSSMDDYEEGPKSESDDDTSQGAAYKRCRLRTLSPALIRSDAESEHDLGEAEDEAPTAENRKDRFLRSRRLAVIQALMARANEIYREHFACKERESVL